jgi:hypothetical protein
MTQDTALAAPRARGIETERALNNNNNPDFRLESRIDSLR